MLLFRLDGLVVDAPPNGRSADLIAIDLTIDAVTADLSMDPFDERLLIVTCKGGMPPPLPVHEQV